MKTAIQNIDKAKALLEAFEAKYQPGDRTVCVHDVPGNGAPPSLTFYGSSDREWILESFGADGWRTQYKSEGWQHAQKMIDGVRVTFYEAHRVVTTPRDTNEIPAALITGREAGIDLAPGAVQEVLA